MHDEKTPALAVVIPQSGAAAPGAFAKSDSAIPDPLKPLTKAEKKVWKYVTDALLDVGLIHRTDVMTIHIVVSTFVRWIDAEERLERLIAEKQTYMVVTPNGYEQPHQSFYVAQKLKEDLLRWLPEACMTIPSFQKVKQAMQEDDGQGDLLRAMLPDFIGAKPRLVHSQ